MSVNQFGGPTQAIEAGDTPDFDDNQVSRLMAAGTISKGQASVMIDGVVNIATAGSANSKGHSPFVPIETKTNTNGDEIRGVTSDQFVALTSDNSGTPIFPGDLMKIGAQDGTVISWLPGDAIDEIYARYIGKEAGILTQGAGTPFTISLSTGVIPDQSLGADEVGWFKLIEANGLALT